MAHADSIPPIVDVVALADSYAKEYHLNQEHFEKVIGCESQWHADIVGDSGTSFGIAQLHYPTRDWGISTSTALDPDTSLKIMAQAWANGQASRWSCWRILYGG